MRIALFGGSFNPPHVVHQMVALYVLETEPIDELWLVPCFRHPFDKALLPFDHRLRMTELAALPLGSRVRVSDVERRLGGDSLTLRTVKHLQAERPQDSFSLIIGGDLVAERESWYGAAELQRLVRFIVVGREGSGNAGGVRMPPVSSTAVRDALRAGQSVDALVPRSVLEHIRTHGLYRAEASSC